MLSAPKDSATTSTMNLLSLSLLLLPITSSLEEEAPPVDQPSFIWPMLGIAAIFYFVMIAPERKRRKQRNSMVEALKKGDKVMTTSGMYGSITQVQGEVITLQIADGVRVKFAVAAIQGKVDEDEGKKNAPDKNDKTLVPQQAESQKDSSDSSSEAVKNSK